MEPIDRAVLQHPEIHIIEQGGTILTARINQEIVGVVALKYVTPGVYEFTKMAVDENFRGLKIGRALSEAAINKARSRQAHSIILYSHTSLINAIALYRKLGFKEIPLDGPYKRSDIKMYLNLAETKPEITMHQATVQDIEVLRDVAIQSFRDLLEKCNTPEDMKLYIDNNFNHRQIEKELREPGTAFFIFFDAGKTIGYVKVRIGYEPEELTGVKALEIERLYCIQEYVGKKAGNVLMQTALDYARKNGFALAWLGVWEHNPRAIAFYQKWGFEKFGSHTFMLGTDAQTDFLMKKNLGE